MTRSDFFEEVGSTVCEQIEWVAIAPAPGDYAAAASLNSPSSASSVFLASPKIM